MHCHMSTTVQRQTSSAPTTSNTARTLSGNDLLQVKNTCKLPPRRRTVPQCRHLIKLAPVATATPIHVLELTTVAHVTATPLHRDPEDAVLSPTTRGGAEVLQARWQP